MANGSRLCLICGDVLGSDAERREHIEREHPGVRVAWRAKLPWIVAADGTETKVGASALKRMRANARKAAGLPRRARPKRVVAAPVEPVAPAIEVPTEEGAPPYFVQAQPPRFGLGGEPVGPAPTDAIPTPEPGRLSREQLRIELGQPFLAEIIRNLSVVVSDWDGAGAAGQFSHTEAAQLAMLLHEPTIEAVDRYFGGNVNRFRLGLAAVVILLGKGRVHYRAIQTARLREAEALPEDFAEVQGRAAAVREVIEVAVDDGSGQYTNGAEVSSAPPAPVDAVEVLAARQRAWRVTPHPEGDA